MGYQIHTTEKEDLLGIIKLFESLPAVEKKHLALNSKMDVIRREIRAGRHAYVLVTEKGIGAFARESGRPNKFIMLEEIVVHPEMRGKGLGSNLLSWLLEKYPKVLAKTFAGNEPIAGLFQKHGFKVVKTSPKGEIMYWERS
ncbi:MAG: hypothetical protein JL56_07870 [Desulfotomaculum sp. BICA1-6]|nr:MAG: hypothetical protein JL56_07870 [Desulfotomaculum sp. BICA1-6]